MKDHLKNRHGLLISFTMICRISIEMLLRWVLRFTLLKPTLDLWKEEFSSNTHFHLALQFGKGFSWRRFVYFQTSKKISNYLVKDMRPEAEDSEATDLTDDSSCGAPAEEAKLYLRKRNKDKKLIKKVADIKVCFFP